MKPVVVLLAMTAAAAADPAPSRLTAAMHVGGAYTRAGDDTSRGYGWGLSFELEGGAFLTDRLAGVAFARVEPTFGTHYSNGDSIRDFKVHYGARFHAFVAPTVFAGVGIGRLDEIRSHFGTHEHDSALAIEAHLGAGIGHINTALVDAVIEIGRANYADPGAAAWGRLAIGIRW